MFYIKYTYVDAVTGISVETAPAKNGPVSPNIVDLEFQFAEESAFPTEVPIMYGTTHFPSKVPGVIAIITESQFNEAYQLEMYKRYVQRVPRSLSQRQARIVLHRHGYLNQVQPIIDGMAEPEKSEAQIAWDYATTIDREDQFTVSLGIALGLSAEQLDDLFIEGATI